MGFDKIIQNDISARIIGQHQNSTRTINIQNDSFSPGQQVLLRISLDNYFEILLLKPGTRQI